MLLSIKKISKSGTRASDLAKQTKLIISNKEMNDIMITVKSVEESGLLIKGISEVIKNETKEQKGGFLRMLLDTLGASLIGNLLTSTGVTRTGECMLRAGQDF